MHVNAFGFRPTKKNTESKIKATNSVKNQVNPTLDDCACRYMGSTLVKWSLPSHRGHFTPPECLKEIARKKRNHTTTIVSNINPRNCSIVRHGSNFVHAVTCVMILAFPHFSIYTEPDTTGHITTRDSFKRIDSFERLILISLFESAMHFSLLTTVAERDSALPNNLKGADSPANQTLRRSGAANTLKLTHCFTITSFKP